MTRIIIDCSSYVALLAGVPGLIMGSRPLVHIGLIAVAVFMIAAWREQAATSPERTR